MEVHGANGYLIHQFLASNTNRRTDGWGGSIEGRIRFGVEVATAVADAIGAEKVGIRISPATRSTTSRRATWRRRTARWSGGSAPLGLAYLHLVESPDRDLTARLRKEWPGTLILNPHTGAEPTGPEALGLIEDGIADLIAFGALFLANPDLPARLDAGGPFNAPDPATFFGGDHRGYTDYPTLSTVQERTS